MARVELGNTAPIEPVKVLEEETDVIRVPLEGISKTETIFELPEDWDLSESIDVVKKVFASHHSDDDPAWVESDNEVLALALSQDLDCPIGRPEDWDEE